MVNMITAVFLYDLFCHYSYDDFVVMRAPLSTRLTLTLTLLFNIDITYLMTSPVSGCFARW